MLVLVVFNANKNTRNLSEKIITEGSSHIKEHQCSCILKSLLTCISMAAFSSLAVHDLATLSSGTFEPVSLNKKRDSSDFSQQEF